MEMGQKIYNLRTQKGMTLEELGEKVGVGKSTVRKWENGIIANMKRDKIAKISEALNTTPAYLMGWTDEEEKAEQSNYEMIETPLYKALNKLEIGNDELTSDEINNIVQFVEFMRSNKK